MAAETGGGSQLMKVRSSSALDRATIIGLIGGMLAVLFAIILGGSPGSFIDIPSILVVVVGTTCLVTACYTFAQIRTARKLMRSTFRRVTLPPSQVAMQLVNLCEIARKNGILSLQNMTDTIKEQDFLHHGVEMVIDSTPPEELERVLRLEIENKKEQSQQAINVFKKGADLAPAMGLIGTLVGLVQMLANLDDPNTIGPSMAVALLTTFYGACLANMVFTPLATKLEGNSDDDMLLFELYVQGVVAVARQESPRRLEMLLNTILPENMKISYFDDFDQ